MASWGLLLNPGPGVRASTQACPSAAGGSCVTISRASGGGPGSLAPVDTPAAGRSRHEPGAPRILSEVAGLRGLAQVMPACAGHHGAWGACLVPEAGRDGDARVGLKRRKTGFILLNFHELALLINLNRS